MIARPQQVSPDTVVIESIAVVVSESVMAVLVLSPARLIPRDMQWGLHIQSLSWLMADKVSPARIHCSAGRNSDFLSSKASHSTSPLFQRSFGPQNFCRPSSGYPRVRTGQPEEESFAIPCLNTISWNRVSEKAASGTILGYVVGEA